MTTATSHRVRDELQDLAVRDLLGPQRELVLVTHSARPQQLIVDAPAGAIGRRVEAVVVGTLPAAASLIAGPEPAASFRDVAGGRLWQWPSEE